MHYFQLSRKLMIDLPRPSSIVLDPFGWLEADIRAFHFTKQESDVQAATDFGTQYVSPLTSTRAIRNPSSLTDPFSCTYSVPLPVLLSPFLRPLPLPRLPRLLPPLPLRLRSAPLSLIPLLLLAASPVLRRALRQCWVWSSPIAGTLMIVLLCALLFATYSSSASSAAQSAAQSASSVAQSAASEASSKASR